jgi:hypothetical protein
MEALVYLPDIETLHGIHTDWPEEMRVILCLHDDGHCDLRLHHVEEGVEAALGDVIEQLRVAADRVQVVPATGKYPSRQMRFAEEQPCVDCSMKSLIFRKWRRTMRWITATARRRRCLVS